MDVGCSTFDPCVSPADNPSLLSHVPVTVQVLDVNDNPPEVAADGEVIVCESSRPGQVSVSRTPRPNPAADWSARCWGGYVSLLWATWR